MKTKKRFMAALVYILCFSSFSIPSMAEEISVTEEADTEIQEEDGEQDGYITIAVDAEDDNGDLMYAIDSDAPEAFGESNIFMIDPALPHTIYVRDAAGNVSSQSFQPIGVEYSNGDSYQQDDQSPSADLDATGTNTVVLDAAEDGSGTVYDKIVTDGSDDFRRVFYTLTTKEGEVFYLVIDQNRGQDNVYLLNMVTVDELQALAAENGYLLSERRKEEYSQMDYQEEETIEELTGAAPAQDSKKSSKTNAKGTIVIVIVAVLGGGGYYYLKVYKKKKDAAMDEIDQALEMDAFVSVSDEQEDEGDEIDMPVDQTISDDEFYNGIYDDDEEESTYLDMDPDEGEE